MTESEKEMNHFITISFPFLSATLKKQVLQFKLRIPLSAILFQCREQQSVQKLRE